MRKSERHILKRLHSLHFKKFVKFFIKSLNSGNVGIKNLLTVVIKI